MRRKEKRKQRKKTWLPLLVAVTLCVLLLPASVLAEEETPAEVVPEPAVVPEPVVEEPVVTAEPSVTENPVVIEEEPDPAEEEPTEITETENEPGTETETDVTASSETQTEAPSAIEETSSGGSQTIIAYGTVYTINGIRMTYASFSSSPGQCWAYASSFYTVTWGQGFNHYFSDSDNYLRELSDSQLTLTEEHLKEYVSNAAIGSVIRICNSAYLHDTDALGHSQFIVQKDDDGFTVFEGGLSASPYCREQYYTWHEYCTIYSYDFIKYIKWPGASPYGQTQPEQAETVAVEGICGDGLFWRLTTNGALYISGDGEMFDYASPADTPWCSALYGLKQIVVCNGVTSIGEMAFSFVTQVMGALTARGGDSMAAQTLKWTGLALPSEIGCDVFWQHAGLISGVRAGGACLTSVSIPGSVTSIGNGAFSGCAALGNVYYGGTAEQWQNVCIGSANDCLPFAAVHYAGGSALYTASNG